MLEAAGCLACFQNLIDTPVVFLGTGNCTHLRLYFARNANEEERKETFIRPRSKSLAREMGEIAGKPLTKSRSKSTSVSQENFAVHTIIREVFSDRIVSFDAFLQLAAILWRMKVCRYDTKGSMTMRSYRFVCL